jgi:hypothetical protein
MNKMTKITKVTIICFYVTVLSILSVKVVETVFSGSVLVGKSNTLSQLRIQKSQLEQEKSALQEQLGHSTSLAIVTKADTVKSYVPIDTPIVLEVSTTVASK